MNMDAITLIGVVATSLLVSTIFTYVVEAWRNGDKKRAGMYAGLSVLAAFGGMFTYALACSRGSRLRGIAHFGGRVDQFE